MMLIRSQNREVLAPLNRPIFVDGCNIVLSEETENGAWKIGEYASKSRCIEILYEIQEKLNIREGRSDVYQMPEK